MKNLFAFTCSFILLFSTNINELRSQIIMIVPLIMMTNGMPEYGFLPGSEFPYYPAIEKYDFQNSSLRVELYDDRDSLDINLISCSDVSINNNSEFASPQSILKVYKYIDTLFKQSGLSIDSSSQNILQIRLQVLDSRLTGSFFITVHGLCQMEFNYKNISQIYCIDLKDGDENSPLGRFEFATRKTASRYLTSAAIRDVIEQFFKYLSHTN